MFAVIFSAVLLFTSVFFIIMFSDLECVRPSISEGRDSDHADWRVVCRRTTSTLSTCATSSTKCVYAYHFQLQPPSIGAPVVAERVPDVTRSYLFTTQCAFLKLLQFVLPEMIAHAFLTTTFLFSFQFIALIINAPLVAYNVNKIMQKQHMYDATEIFRTLGAHKKECFIKLG